MLSAWLIFLYSYNYVCVFMEVQLRELITFFAKKKCVVLFSFTFDECCWSNKTEKLSEKMCKIQLSSSNRMKKNNYNNSKQFLWYIFFSLFAWGDVVLATSSYLNICIYFLPRCSFIPYSFAVKHLKCFSRLGCLLPTESDFSRDKSLWEREKKRRKKRITVKLEQIVLRVCTTFFMNILK